MSLLSKKNLFASLDKPDSYPGKIRSSSNKRKKPPQKRRFRIADEPLGFDPPFILGKNEQKKSSSIGSFGFLSSPSLDILDSAEPLLKPSSSASVKSSVSLFSSDTSERGKIVQEALASSKLSSLTPEGPIEPAPRLGKRKLKAAKKAAKSLTKGSKWFNMSKVEITKEKKNDLEVLKLRSAMAGSHHYKRNHMTHTPNYFHVGTIKEASADFYSSRLTKKQRKNTLAEEFAADFGI